MNDEVYDRVREDTMNDQAANTVRHKLWTTVHDQVDEDMGTR